jgi:hypothetical protein
MTSQPTRWLWRATLGVVLAVSVVVIAGPYRTRLVGAAVGSQGPDNRPAPCLPGTAVPIMESPHIAPSEAHTVTYNSEPPTSGPHYSFVAATGIYTAPVPDGLAVHALEHGHVVIGYGVDTPAADLAALTAIAKRHPADVLLQPRPGLTGVAMTAWSRLDHLDAFDRSRVEIFVERLAGRYDHGWTRTDPC